MLINVEIIHKMIIIKANATPIVQTVDYTLVYMIIPTRPHNSQYSKVKTQSVLLVISGPDPQQQNKNNFIYIILVLAALILLINSS